MSADATIRRLEAALEAALEADRAAHRAAGHADGLREGLAVALRIVNLLAGPKARAWAQRLIAAAERRAGVQP